MHKVTLIYSLKCRILHLCIYYSVDSCTCQVPNGENMNLNEKLRMLRNQKKLTQEQAAKEIGVSTRTYKAYELGERKPQSHQTFLNIAQFYNIPIEIIMDDNLSIEENLNDSDSNPDALLKEMLGLFAGGKLSLEDKKTVLDTLEEAYYIAKLKEENHE